MLNAFYEQTNQLKATFIKQMSDDGEDVFLPPRQEEIKNIIKEHKMVSFDFLRRRFIKIPERTIRYDLKKLSDANIIVKIGKTKGALYKVR
jgi:predicted HTH transcriptional regulator